MVGRVFAAPAELVAVADRLHTVTWILLGIVTVALAGPMGSAIYCIWSRTCSSRQLCDMIATAHGYGPDRYAPDISCFFQVRAVLYRSKSPGRTSC